jgi:hypothetical protein
VVKKLSTKKSHLESSTKNTFNISSPSYISIFDDLSKPKTLHLKINYDEVVHLIDSKPKRKKKQPFYQKSQRRLVCKEKSPETIQRMESKRQLRIRSKNPKEPLQLSSRYT